LNESDVSRYDSLGPEEVLAKWREVTKSPERKRVPDYFGVAKDCDVVCFVLETAPSRCLDLNGNMDDLPNLKRLKERAWIAPNHVTTYPYTSSALFSILTSWYPTDVQYLQVAGKGRVAPGLMRSLGVSGYATAACLPFVENAEDENLRRAVGISKIVYAETARAPIANREGSEGWRETVRRDRAALELLKEDLSGWIQDNRRYAVLFLPQIGHAPWPDVTEDGANRDTVSRGRAIMALQDKWLGELLGLLEAAGRLEHTIILVTGDHGIRTRMEDPDFVGGMIDPYSFRVPCVLFAPKAIQKTVVIPWITSHVDLSPSILDLVGVTEGRGFELGSPVWDERLCHRTTFFWANKYLGADGFHENGKYYMWQYMSDTIYCNSVFDFKGLEPVEKGASVGEYVTGKIGDGMALQHRITRVGSKTE
jgi:membrane-anchored protein YejM (alkaline phosphatase superfamily)